MADEVYNKDTDPMTNPPEKPGRDKKQKKSGNNNPRMSFERKAALGKAPSSADLPHNSVDWASDKAWAPVDKYIVERDAHIPKLAPGNGDYNQILDGSNFTNLIPNDPKTVRLSVDSTGAGTLVTTTPGCAVLYYFPTMGASSNMNSDPVNRATDMVYSYIVNTEFGNNPPYWSHTDVGMHIYKVSNIIHMLDFARLILTAGNQRPDQNYNMPQCYYKAIRLTKDPVNDTYVDAYGAWQNIYNRRWSLIPRFNQLVDSLNTIHFPDGLPILRAHKQLLDCWYADCEDVERGQLYAFAPIGFWHYVEDHPDPDDPKTWAGYLEFDRIYNWHSSHMWCIDDLLDKIETWLNEYKFKSSIQWEIGNTIQAAYGSENMWQYKDMIPEGAVTQPATYYSEGVLESIENAVIVNDLNFYKIQADPLKNKLIGRPQVNYGTDATNVDQLQLFWNIPLRFNSGTKAISYDHMANALKFHPIASYVQVHDDDLTTRCIDFGACFGTEIITEMVLVWRNPAPGQSVADGMKYGWEEHRITKRTIGNAPLWLVSDWARHPVFINVSNSLPASNVSNIKLNFMSGDRTYEVISNEAQSKIYFKSMTEYLWGSDISRSTRALYSESSRKKIGL